MLQEVFQVVRKNYDSLVNTTRWNLLLGARFLHMLYRQKFRVTVREDLDFIRTVIHDVVTNNNLENLDLVTILKVRQKPELCIRIENMKIYQKLRMHCIRIREFFERRPLLFLQ